MKLDNSLALMQHEIGKNKLNDLSQDDKKLKEQTDKFEAFFIKKVLDISLKNDNKLFPKDAGDKIYNSMYNDTLSGSLSGSFGFSELLFNFLKQKG